MSSNSSTLVNPALLSREPRLLSSSERVVIDARGVGKSYRIRTQPPPTTFGEAAVARIRRFGRSVPAKDFRALDDVGFKICAGEAVGIVGRNGAGKSTLLKILTRVTAPTEGEVDIQGRLGSLLEVGTGFHPELTARENIYLNGSILGMRKKEIDASFDQIVEFAGVEKFLDTPVKRYSSGMYVRLAFAVAAHLPSDILLIDEVLAVGDSAFKAKSIAKMKSVLSEGRTILFVSHHLPSVEELCNRVIVLDAGKLVFEGSTDAGLRYYRQNSAGGASVQSERRRGNGTYRLERFEPVTPDFLPSAAKTFRFAIRNNSAVDSCIIGARILDEDLTELVSLDSSLLEFAIAPGADLTEGTFEIRTPWLKPGSYSMDVFLYNTEPVDEVIGACTFLVSEDLPYPGVVFDYTLRAPVVLGDFEWKID